MWYSIFLNKKPSIDYITTGDVMDKRPAIFLFLLFFYCLIVVRVYCCMGKTTHVSCLRTYVWEVDQKHFIHFDIAGSNSNHYPRSCPHCLLSFQALSSTPCQRKKMLHHFLKKKKMCEHFMNMGHAETFLWGPCEHSMQLKLFLCYIQQILLSLGLCVSLWNTLQPDCYINKFYPFLHHQLFFCLKVNFVCLLFCLIGFIQ